jgi:hypothetical protein
MSRYGYTEESQNRIEEINRQVADIQTQSTVLLPYLSEELSNSIFELSNQDVRGALAEGVVSQSSAVPSFPPLPGGGGGGGLPGADIDINRDTDREQESNADYQSLPPKREKKENILQKQVSLRYISLL